MFLHGAEVRRVSEVPGSGNYFTGEGEMARLVRAKDWSKTSLGAIDTWPQSLLTTVSLCLASNFPINIIWGPEANQIYNDGYRVVCGDAHPRALGESYRITWASAWPAIGGPFEVARGGETSFLENQRMFLTRNGYLEETFFTFSLSPIRDESGGIGGLFHPVTETTASMLAERRTRALRDLTATLAGAAQSAEIGALAASVLARFDLDVPFLLIYSRASEGEYRLGARQGMEADCHLCPQTLALASMDPWPLGKVAQGHEPVEVASLRSRFGESRCGPYEEAPDRAFVVPLNVTSCGGPELVMVAGASPRLPWDDAYRGFIELVGAAIGAAQTQVKTREEERARAEALAAIDRAKTAFFSNVSHEFRTPLTLMLGPLEDALGAADDLPQDQRDRLDIAYRNALRLLKLVNALLDFSRVEAGRVEAQFEPVDLAHLTTELASNFQSACEKAGLSLVVDCPPLSRPIYVDVEMWEKIVLNLLSNAVKFTLVGTIEVRLSETPTGARMDIRDTGSGIPADELENVFQRFHRIDGQVGRTQEGSGIGLSLVQELTSIHGGHAAVASVEGKGSTFTIEVPFGPDQLPADQLRAPKTALDPNVRANTYVQEAERWVVPGSADEKPEDGSAEGRPRIVLADDNADMRDYVRRILEAAGYTVEAVSRGDSALAAIRRDRLPDLVLSDVMMPGMDGFELVSALRADPAMDGLPIILLSARAGEEARVDGLASGADDYLVKPFSARELRARIDGAVRLARQRADSASRERSLHTLIATERAKHRLRETEETLAFTLNAGRLGSWDIDLETGVLSASEICRATFGLAADAPYDRQTLIDQIHPDDRARRDADLQATIDGHGDLDLEYRVLRPDGSEGWVLVRGRADYDSAGRPVRLAGVSLDITDRKRADRRQRLLLDELNHRVKNTLASVQSIAMQTRRTAISPDAFNIAFDARITALSNAHDLLTRTSWDGVMLKDMLDLTLEPYAARRPKVIGPEVLMGPTAAVSLGMAFHELATNAAKYGALSVEEGSVSVIWRIDRNAEGDVIQLEWRETGGPSVSTPARRGFGSRLLTQGIPRELGGQAGLNYAPQGVVYWMTVPFSQKLKAA